MNVPTFGFPVMDQRKRPCAKIDFLENRIFANDGQIGLAQVSCDCSKKQKQKQKTRRPHLPLTSAPPLKQSDWHAATFWALRALSEPSNESLLTIFNRHGRRQGPPDRRHTRPQSHLQPSPWAPPLRFDCLCSGGGGAASRPDYEIEVRCPCSQRPRKLHFFFTTTNERLQVVLRGRGWNVL